MEPNPTTTPDVLLTIQSCRYVILRSLSMTFVTNLLLRTTLRNIAAILSLSGNDKIRNHLVANTIHEYFGSIIRIVNFHRQRYTHNAMYTYNMF